MRVLDPRLYQRARAVRTLLVVDSVLAVVVALLVLAQAFLLARVAARAFGGASLDDVAPALVLLGLVVIARAGGAWGFEVAGRRAAAEVVSQLRLDVVDARLRRRPAALDGTQTSEVTTTAVTGVDALEATFARYLPQIVLAAVVPIAVLAIVVSIDPLAAGVMVLTLPLVPVFMWLVGRQTARKAHERWQALALLSNHFLDVVRGLPTLRAFNRGAVQAERIASVSDEYRATTMGTLRLAFLSGAILELAATLGIALVAVVVGVRLAEGNIGFEAALTVLVLTPELYLPIRNLAAQWHASADGAAVAERLLDLSENPPAVPVELVLRSSAKLAPITFERVSYRYPTRELDVLRDVELVIEPGEAVALVGPSGSGKSTLLSLIMCFAEPSSGRILVGGDDLAGIDPKAWRHLTAYVPQHPMLFRGTIADNIRLGAPAAADEDVRAAAALARAHDFVDALPDGYETVVGEGGRAVSAGERRRIALARAFVRDAPLVLLDEPTADLDPESASIVADAVDLLREGRTLVVVAHRPELAARADRIVRIGAVAEAVA